MSKSCLQCNNLLEKRKTESNRDFEKRIYCNRSCRGKHVNQKFKNKPVKTSPCEMCGILIELKPQKNGGYTKKKYCDSCRIKVYQNRTPSFSSTLPAVHERTKAEVFQRNKNWQSARTVIRRHACIVYRDSGKPMACQECGYTNHIEICHIKAVSEFSGKSLIREINSPTNLVALCPNHHWELDNGLLELKSEAGVEPAIKGL